jgi:orotate phosphoribosyltransferase
MKMVAKSLLAIDAVGFAPEKPITFKSGIISPVYVDNRRLPFHPQAWHTIIHAFANVIQRHTLTYDIIAGVAMGGVPHSAALAYHTKKPSVFVRKAPKEHGKTERIEGGDVDNKRILLIEDLVTTGGSSLDAIAHLRESGAQITDMLAIVSYGFAEAQTNFSQANVNLYTLTDFSTILQEAHAMQRFTAQQHAVIQDWFSDPYGWAQRQGFSS